MEQACFKEMNRLVRTRMLGGVGGARRKPAPIPIALLYGESERFGTRIPAYCPM